MGKRSDLSGPRVTDGATSMSEISERLFDIETRLARLPATGWRNAGAEVAVLSGFYDQSHLTRCFVRHLGITPHRYARRVA